MKALVFEPQRKLHLDTAYPPPAEQVGEAIVQVQRAGICNTDLEITLGYMDYQGVLGHEFVGTVQQVASKDAEVWVGQRVVGEINAACGYCAMCVNNYPTHCLNRTVLGIFKRAGTMAEYLSLPIQNLHRVPASISDAQAAFVEPLAAACEILEQVHIRPTERVIVIGDGKLGLLIVQVLRLSGAAITLIGRHPERAALLGLRGVNFVAAPAPDDEDASRQLVEKFGLSDLVVECTGNQAGLSLAKQLVRPRGTIILKSTYHGAPTIPLSTYVVDEINVVGSRCGPFEPALRLLDSGLVKVEPLLSATFKLEQGEAAFRHAFEQGVLKVQLAIS
jgi:alcohol dehydrogenase